jgi:hypothetical protein
MTSGSTDLQTLNNPNGPFDSTTVNGDASNSPRAAVVALRVTVCKS